jgi:hypothetical protein
MGDRVADDPEAWSAANGGRQPLGYSNLLVSNHERGAVAVAVAGYPGPEHRPLL